MWNLKNNTNESIYKTETDQTWNTNLRLPNRKGSGGSMGLTFTNIHKTHKQQGPAVEHRALYSISSNNLQWKMI